MSAANIDERILHRQGKQLVARGGQHFADTMDKFIAGEKRRSDPPPEMLLAAIGRAMGLTLAGFITVGGGSNAAGAIEPLTESLLSEAEKACAWAAETGFRPASLAGLSSKKITPKLEKRAERSYDRAFKLIFAAAQKFLGDEQLRLPDISYAQFLLALAEALGSALGLFIASCPPGTEQESLKVMINLIKSAAKDAL
jgi:hypothetical protein